MNSNKQSSVEWFAKESWNLQIRLENKEITIGEYGVTYVDLLEQAKAIHEEEKYETKAFWFGRGVLAAKEDRIEELKPKKTEQ